MHWRFLWIICFYSQLGIHYTQGNFYAQQRSKWYFTKKKYDDISCTSSIHSLGPYKCSYYMYLTLTGLAQSVACLIKSGRSRVPHARPLLTKNNQKWRYSLCNARPSHGSDEHIKWPLRLQYETNIVSSISTSVLNTLILKESTFFNLLYSL